LPPQSLERAVWPFVDEWLEWFDAAPVSTATAPHGRGAKAAKTTAADNAGEETADRCDLAAQGFLRLLRQFRIVLLQNSVIMRQEFPDHPLWTDSVFERDVGRLRKTLSSARDQGAGRSTD
jgi:hypothetical protein